MQGYVMRVYWKELGGHTHLRIFVGKESNIHLGKAGEIVMRNEEFAAFRDDQMKIMVCNYVADAAPF